MRKQERESEKCLKPEIELLLCCSRRALNGAHESRLKEILQKQIDWEFLFFQATQNGLLPLLCEHLGRLNTIPVQFRDTNRKDALRAFFLTAEVLRITNRFSQRKVPLLPYKGPVLGQLAYANPLLRQFDDLDFVVPQTFMGDVYEEMGALGYEPKFQRSCLSTGPDEHIPGEYVFVHKVNRVVVEIHTEATLRHFPRPPNIQNMSRRSMEITLNGRQVATFDWADTLLLLCVHGAKDFWSRLIWIADVAPIIDRLEAPDWEHLFAEAKKYDADRMLRLGLWLARAVFGAKFPGNVLQNVESDRTVAQVGNELCEQLLYEKKKPRGAVWRSYYRIRMVQPIWKGTLYWLRLSTAPTEEDWATFPNEGGRGVRHSFRRPLRLWRKYRHSVESNNETQT